MMEIGKPLDLITGLSLIGSYKIHQTFPVIADQPNTKSEGISHHYSLQKITSSAIFLGCHTLGVMANLFLQMSLT